MYLNNNTGNQNGNPGEPPPEIFAAAREESNEKLVSNSTMVLIDLFKRDLKFWIWAVYKNVIFIILAAVAGAVALFGVRSVMTKARYSSRCALVRQEASERGSGRPPGFTPPRTNVLFNIFLSRNCLQDTIRQLNLNWTPEQMFKALSVKQASKNSNYIFLTATASNPQLSAQISNTHAEVFIEHYKKLLQEYVKTPYENIQRNTKQLSDELEILRTQLKRITEENKIGMLEKERDSLELRVTQEDEKYQQSFTDMEILRVRLKNLEASQAKTPPKIELYSERSTESERALTKLRLQLAEMRQRYTENNPVIIAQLELIKTFESNMAKNDDGQMKVVIGNNPDFSKLNNQIVELKAELDALETQTRQRKDKLERLNTRRSILNRIAPTYTALQEQISLKRSLLSKQLLQGKELEMFSEQDFSDISIYEMAIPSAASTTSRKRGLWAAIGFFFGGAAAVGFFLLKEALNFSVRSKNDLEVSLHLPVLGVIPCLQPETRADFYSSLQTIIAKCTKIFEDSQKEGPYTLVIATGDDSLEYERTLSEILNMVDVKDIRYTRIKVVVDQTETTGLVNDFLYGLTDELPKPDRSSQLFFKLDDMAFFTPPPRKRIQELCKATKRQLVVWELFSYEMHPQFCSDICRTGELTVFPVRCAEVSKCHLNRLAATMRQNGVTNLQAVLYAVESKYYRKGII